MATIVTGQRRHKIDIEYRTSGNPETSGVAESWATLYRGLWAFIEVLRGEEKVIAMQTQAQLTHRLNLRFHPGIKPSMRVKFGGRYFNIMAPPINIDERNSEMELMCGEVVYG